MKRRVTNHSWRAVLVFYLVLVLVITVLDISNHIMSLAYLASQIGLITVGLAIFWIIGYKWPDLSAQRGVLLAFSIGILTIIPGVLMSLNPPQDFWESYFLVAGGMAAGSFLGFLFIKLTAKRLQ